MSQNNSQDSKNLQGGPDLDTIRRDDRPDEAQKARTADERSGAPFPTTPPDPDGSDPHMAGALNDAMGDDIEEGSGELSHQGEPLELDETGADGPTYERDQGPDDDHSGGSTDPNNTLSHSDTQTRVEEK